MNLRFFLLFVSFLVVSGPAAAAEPARTSLWIDARPWTCLNLVEPLAHEIALACDAAGGRCGIAANAEQADRRIVLRCKEGPSDGESRWVLDAESKTGERLWSVDLAGDEDERLRRAALWVARIDADGDAAPPPPPAPPPAPSTPAPPPRPRDAAPAVAPTSTHAETSGGVAFSAHGGYETTGDGPPLIGARGVAAVRVGGGTRAILALDGVRPTQTNVRPFSLFRAGLGAAWGAPFSDDVLGASVEVGGALVHSYRVGGTRGAPYGAVSLTAQYPNATLRPFVTTSLAVFAMKGDGFDSTSSLGPMVSLDVGLAWSAW